MNIQAWNRLAREGLRYDGVSNVMLDFTKMTKKFGKEYIDMLAIAYACKYDMPDDEFRQLWGDVPQAFLEKRVIPVAAQIEVIVRDASYETIKTV